MKLLCHVRYVMLKEFDIAAVFYAASDFREEDDINQDHLPEQRRQLIKRYVQQKPRAENNGFISVPALLRDRQDEAARAFEMGPPGLPVAPVSAPHGNRFIEIGHVPDVLRTGRC